MSQESTSGRNDRTEEFLRLYGQHDRALYAFILALVPNWADADDLAQETRLRLWQQFDKYAEGTDFEAWARSIAYYLILARREKEARNKLRFGLSFYQAVAKEYAAVPELLFLRQKALKRCVEKLEPQRRKLLEDYYGRGQSLREIAARLGRSYDATRKALYRTQRALADCIELELQQEEAEE